MYKENILESLRKARKAKGYTQQYVAEQTGIPQTTIARIESGTREPSLENLGKLIEFYGISTDSVLGMGSALEENNIGKRQDKCMDSKNAVVTYSERLELLIAEMKAKGITVEVYETSVINSKSSIVVERGLIINEESEERAFVPVWKLGTE